MVDDGDTLVIGGLIAEDVRKNVTKVPILSSIPVLGDLFRSKDYQRGETELVIFLTPRVKEMASGAEGRLKTNRFKGNERLKTPEISDTFGGTTGGGGAGGGGGGTGSGQ
jgi:pilus assembly protein CpaC